MTASSFRYSRITAGTALVVACTLLAAPAFIPGWSHRPGVWTYTLCWAVGIPVLLLAGYYFVYRVALKDGRFAIRSLSTREFSLLDIVNVELKPARGSANLEVRLRNGDVITLSRELEHFAELVAALTLRSR
ncbi:MAG TPA: hypothetical protein VMI92_14395 [Steroidobacteraceae bacterium]|nr:hypothetical protein [Steroidobacteraceae bacterium]